MAVVGTSTGRLVIAAGAVVLGAAVACVGSDPEVSSAPADAGIPDEAGGSIDAPAPPSDCSALYVSPAGAVTNDGCTTKTPLASIGAAIAAVKARNLPTKEIRVCQGTFPESRLVLDIAVSLRGGFDCTTWQTDPAYEYPALKTATETVVQNGNYALSGETLTIDGPGLGAAVIVEGLTIQGGPAGAAGVVDGTTSTAVRIAGGASPTFRKNRIIGGSTRATSLGSLGVDVGPGSAPEIAFNDVDGGRGVVTNDRYGSVGVRVNKQANPHIHGNSIRGGAGQGDAAYMGSLGVLLHSEDDTAKLWKSLGRAFEDNVVSGGTGRGATLGSCGVYVERITVDLVGNVIDAGTGVATGGSDIRPASTAIFVFNASYGGPVVVERNRVVGGSKASFTPDEVRHTAAIFAWNPLELHVTNNFVLGGTGASVGARAIWMDLPNPNRTVTIRNNTVVTPSAAAATGGFAAAIQLNRGAQVQNNLVVGRGATNEAAFRFGGCNPSGAFADPAAFENNTVLMTTTTLQAEGSCAGHAFVSDFESYVLTWPAAAASGNVRHAGSCPGGDTGCVVTPVCSAALDCADAFLEPGNFGPIGTGWKLEPNASCIATRGGKDLTDAGILHGKPLPAVATDFYGAARTAAGPDAGFSRGAHEQDAPGCTN